VGLGSLALLIRIRASEEENVAIVIGHFEPEQTVIAAMQWSARVDSSRFKF